jgi:hypothetical protein
LSILGIRDRRSLPSILGVIDLTLPALDSEPCDGIISHPLEFQKILDLKVLINIDGVTSP